MILKMESSYYHKTLRKREDVGNHGSVNALKFTPDSKYIFCASKKNVEIWDIESGSQIKTIKATKMPLSWVNDVAVSPDGKHIASGSMDQTIKIWDLT